MRAVWAMIAVLSCGLMAAEYDERYRPQIHFSPRIHWTNDPCGLVYAFGNFHLFFQHNPFANVWGHMSWGHAVSRDLVQWKQLPVAISDDPDVAIFTGSSVFDATDTSGLCKTPSRGCIVSVYTGFTPKRGTIPEKQTQNLAVSQDGLTWTKYTGNPVLDLGRGDTRDPKVFWYEPGKYWVMMIVQAGDRKVRLFRSANLKNWEPLSEFGPQGATGGEWECPDLYALPVQGEPDKMRWILKIGLNPGHIAGGSGEQYFVGQFDGTKFTPDEGSGAIRWLDYGRDCYCALTFNNQPKGQTPRIIGWMNNWQYAAEVPTSPWRGAMTLPREVSLAKVNGALTVLQRPIEELRSLRSDELQYEGGNLDELNRKLRSWGHRSQTFEMETAIRPGNAKQIVWKVLAAPGDETWIGFDAAQQEIFVDRSRGANAQFNKRFSSKTVAPLNLGSEPLVLHVFADRSSIEVFAQNGAVTLTNLVFPNPGSDGVSLDTTDGQIESIRVRMWRLNSIWPKP